MGSKNEVTSHADPLSTLAGAGEMGSVIRAFDWTRTSLGSPDSWSPALMTAVHIVLGSPVPQVLWWGPHHIQLYNDACRVILAARHSEEAVGRPASECGSDTWSALGPLVEASLTGGAPVRDEVVSFEIERADGLEEVHFAVTCSPVPDATAPGGIGGVLGTLQVISNDAVEGPPGPPVQADMNLALQKSEERYRAIVEGQAEMVCRFHVDGTILFVNGAYARARGTTPERLTGANFWEFVEEEDRPAVRALLDRLRPDAPYVRIENRFETAEGVRWTLWTNRGLAFDEVGRATEVQSSGIDITERKLVEQSLRESERKLALVIDTAPVYIAHFDRECRFQLANRAYAERFGMAPAELTGRHARDVLGAKTFEAVEAHLSEVLEGRTVEFETEVDLPVHGRRYVHARYAPELDADGEVRGFVAVITDVTDRMQAERDQALLAAIVASSQDAIISKTLDGIITTWNAGAERVFGFTAEETIGRPVLMLIPPDRRHEESIILNRVRRGERVDPFDTVRRRKDGRRIDVSVTISPVRDASGRVVGASKVARDITARKRSEQALRDSEERLRELTLTLERRVVERTSDLEERNKELQTFAYIASHDLREPLRKIQSFADLLEDEEGNQLGKEGRFFLERMRSAASRMDGLLADLLSFSRVATHAGHTTLVHLDRVVADVLRDYELTIRETRAEVEVDAAVVLEADAPQMRQLVSNLIGNALKYRRPDVPPRVRIAASIADDAVGDVAGPACRIVVEDNGIGFENEYEDRIFEPFERLHGRGAYEGTGMGLAICRRIVLRHRGSIRAESRKGEGSRFIVHLPARQDEED